MALLCITSVLFSWGCGKKAVSSSGDEFAGPADKGKAGPVETIKPDQMVTVPDRPSAPIDTARSQIDAGSPAAPVSPPPGGIATSPAAPLSPTPSGGAGIADIFFDFDQYAIRKDAQPTLEANAAWIRNAPSKSILIEGHCDERGTQAYNLVLGEKRARAAKRYLQDLGVPASRLKIISYGEVRPFCKEQDERCYQLNRRAHFVVQ